MLNWLQEPARQTRDIDVLITGVGLLATTYSLTRQVGLKRPGLIIQAGIGGSFNKTLPLGTVVAVQKDTIADLGVMEKRAFKTVFELGLISRKTSPFTNGWLVNKSDLIQRSKLKKVTAISINEITTSAKRIREYKKMFTPTIESMEGASLHYVCGKENIPFFQLRAISNYVGVRDKKKWKLKESIINLNKELIQLLEVL